MGKNNDFIYDEIRVGKNTYNFRAGKENFIEDLAKKFPNERKAIEEYVKLCVEVSKKDMFFNLKIMRPRWLSYLLNYFCSNKFFEMNNKSALEVIQSLTQDLDLQAALLGTIW